MPAKLSCKNSDCGTIPFSPCQEVRGRAEVAGVCSSTLPGGTEILALTFNSFRGRERVESGLTFTLKSQTFLLFFF